VDTMTGARSAALLTLPRATLLTLRRGALHAPAFAALLALAFGATPMSAQLPQASATALGMGYNTTASTRGFAAIANNPAGLGLDDSPDFSLAVPALAVQGGLGPVTLADLAEWEGRLVPASVKDEWLERVRESGGQSGPLLAGATPVALSLGSFGFQLSTQVGGEANLAPDAVELMLYGNAGRTGSAQDFDLEGSSLDGFILTTAAVAWGFRATDRLHLGVTGTYSVGSGLLVGRDVGSAFRSDPLGVEIRFPVLYPAWEEGEKFDNGSGVGLDVGALWVGPSLKVGATIQNLVSTFDWDLDGFSYVAGEGFFELGPWASDFEERPATGAPRTLLDAAEELTLKPVFAVGAELEPSPLLRLSGDIRKRVSGGLAVGPDFHMGVGAELRAVSFLPLYGHFSVVSEGVQLGGGASLVLGPVSLSGAGAYRTGDYGDGALGMVTLSFGAN